MTTTGQWFTVSARPAGAATVYLDGHQYPDGTVLHGVMVTIDDLELLDVGEARRLAAVLVEAADELERLR